MRSSLFRGIGVITLMLAAQCHPASAQQSYQPELLFSLAYGKEADQIGIHPASGDEGAGDPASLAGMCVPAADMIFVADVVQGSIKRYDSRGNLVALADSMLVQTESMYQPEVIGRLHGIDSLAGTSDGRFFAALYGNRLRTEAFDGTGAPIASVRDAAGDLIESRGWSKLEAQVIASVPRAGPRPDVDDVSTDQFGNVYLTVSPAPTDYNAALVKFDGTLNIIATVPGFRVGWDGRTYGFVPNKFPEPNDRLRVWSPDGELEAVITLQPPANISKGDYDPATHRWRGVSGVLFDASGCIYMVYDDRRPKDEWVELMPNFKITDDTVIYKFDHNGHFVLKLVLNGLPFGMYPPIAVDPAGNIYHLEYYKDRVDFVKETLVVASP